MNDTETFPRPKKKTTPNKHNRKNLTRHCSIERYLPLASIRLNDPKSQVVVGEDTEVTSHQRNYSP